jgi:hypothetical protein
MKRRVLVYIVLVATIFMVTAGSMPALAVSNPWDWNACVKVVESNACEPFPFEQLVGFHILESSGRYAYFAEWGAPRGGYTCSGTPVFVTAWKCDTGCQ